MSDPEIVAAATGATENGANPTAATDAKVDEKSPEAMFKLAQVLHKGDKDTPKDLPRAVELYQSALEKGHMAARGPLLEILEATPAASPEDTTAAMEMMGVGDEEMDENTMQLEKAGELEKSDPKQALEIYNSLINEEEDPDAMNALAIFLEAGVEDKVPADPKRAAELYNQAAEHEHYEAMFNLAVLLVKGANGVPKDPVKAVKLYETVG